MTPAIGVTEFNWHVYSMSNVWFAHIRCPAAVIVMPFLQHDIVRVRPAHPRGLHCYGVGFLPGKGRVYLTAACLPACGCVTLLIAGG